MDTGVDVDTPRLGRYDGREGCARSVLLVANRKLWELSVNLDLHQDSVPGRSKIDSGIFKMEHPSGALPEQLKVG